MPISSFQEALEATIGSCNGFTASQRFTAETAIFAKKILSFVRDKAEILDYGNGHGRLAKEILTQNSSVSVVGVDDSLDMLKQAREYVNNDNFSAKIPTELDGDNKQFNLAYLVYVLQHVPAIEIREILSRIYSHLKDDGYFIYCSSDYRMSIRFDGKGFFDDRFLGVNLQEEVERYFDKVGPLFSEEDYKDNPILRKMITGINGGLAHPAFVYKKKKDINTVVIVSGKGELIESKSDITITIPEKLLLINRLSPGDILVMTNAIRDLHLAYPNTKIDVRTPCPAIFNNNPHITKLQYNEAEYCNINTWFASNQGKTKMLGDIMCVDMQYPLIHSSGARGAHFAEGHREFLEDTLKVKIPQTKIRPELYLTAIEKSKAPNIEGKYWVINAGSKSDYTLKQYPYYQEVVNLLKNKVQFVQIGIKNHLHQPLEGVIDMVGKTDSLRDLFSLIYNAEGVLTCVSLPMHVAAAFKKPCVVVAGAREGTRWELYPNHRFIYVNGCLPCADYDGCWRSSTSDCTVKIKGVPKCMTLIKPEEVAREVERYYEGGILRYDRKEPVILNLKGEEKMEEKKITDVSVVFPTVTQSGTELISELIYNPFPPEINSPQATASIFNNLRILKQINPTDNYLEAYQWHYNKRKEKFMDTYHFLQFLGATVSPKRILEIGTRTGISICQLLSAYHSYDELERVILCDVFNDGLATPSVVITNLKYLNIPTDKVEFIVGDSIIEIPKLIMNEDPTFDYILVDGNHDKDYARKDLENAVQLIEKGGYVIMDDLSPDGCSLQDVWDEFKQNNSKDFIFMEDHVNGKGLGVAVKK